MKNVNRPSFQLAALALVALAAATITGARLAAQQQDAPPDQSEPGEKTPPAVKPSDAAGATSRPADGEPAPRKKVSSADILRELQRDDINTGRVVTPSDPKAGIKRETVTAAALPQNAVAPVDRKLLPDGSRLVDRPGRLVRDADGFVFSFESRGQGEVEIPMRLLPNRLLEDMEIISENGTRPVVFLVSGEVTEYHGANYLLVQKMLTKSNLGNLR